MKSKTLTLLFLATLPLAAPAQHSHSYAGDSNGDGFLDFAAPLPSRTMSFADSGNNFFDEGFFYNGSFTHTAAHGSNSTVSDPQGALSGTFVDINLWGVTGPTGATFGFYETGATDVTLSMTTGTMNGTGSFGLTQQAFFDAGDPYGHIHGRRFVATEAGTYTVTWTLENSGTGGTAGSVGNPDAGQRVFTQTFTAVPEPGTITLMAIAASIGLYAWRRRRAA